MTWRYGNKEIMCNKRHTVYQCFGIDFITELHR